MENATKDAIKEYDIENTEQLLSLMQIYLTEWTHRDVLLWKQVFQYFFASLIVMVLPFVDLWGFHLGEQFPVLFPIIGLLISIIFFIIGQGYAIRLQAIGTIYNNLIEKLPEEYRRKKLKEISSHSILTMSMAKLIIWTMFILLCLLGVALILISVGVVKF